MSEHKEHIVSPITYIVILILLMALLALTLTAAFVDLDKFISGGAHRGTAYWNMIVALVIAVLKAVLIILFFMHVKFSSRLTWAFAAAGFVWLGIMITLSMSDYATRNYPPGTPLSNPMEASPAEVRPAPSPSRGLKSTNGTPLPHQNIAPMPSSGMVAATGHRGMQVLYAAGGAM